MSKREMGATTAQWGDNNSAIRGNNMAMGQQQQHNQGKWREMGGDNKSVIGGDNNRAMKDSIKRNGQQKRHGATRIDETTSKTMNNIERSPSKAAMS